MSNTIQQLHDLVNANETQQGADDRITGSEVRTVDNTIIDEIARRGIVISDNIGDMSLIPVTESGQVYVQDDGLFSKFETPDPPDNVDTFASATAGWVWKRVPDSNFANKDLTLTANRHHDGNHHNFTLDNVENLSLFANQNLALIGELADAGAPAESKIVVHDSVSKEIKKSISLEAFTEWVQTNFQVKPVFLDDVFTQGMGTGGNNYVAKISLDAAGNVFLASSITLFNGVTVNKIIKLSSSGILDTAFSTAQGTGVNGTPSTIVVQPDGKILLGGDFTQFNGVTVSSLIRLNVDGSLDTAFNTNLGTGITGGNHIVYEMLLQPDGKIVVGGEFSTVNGVSLNSLARINTDGSPDVAFNTNLTGGLNALGGVYAMGLHSDGKIVFAGNFTIFAGAGVNRIMRVNADGTSDAAFRTAIGTGLDNTPTAIAVQPDGKIIVGGNFLNLNAVSTIRLVRLNNSGTPDTAFQLNIGTSANGQVLAVAVDMNGNVLVAGNFTAFNAVAASSLTRLNPNGTQQLLFLLASGNGVGGAASYNVSNFKVQPDNKVLFGGNFTSVNGAALPQHLARINADLYPAPVSPF